MKKEINKIVLFLGFLATIVGLWIAALLSPEFLGLNFTMIAIILAFAFVNASNTVLNNIGYSISAVLGAIGIDTILKMVAARFFSIGSLVMAIGMIVMSLAALIYLVRFLLDYFGFVKKNSENSQAGASCLWGELNRYKEMLEDGILTEEEFVDLKQKAMEGADNQISSMDDLKKWKKLLDQQVITEEEFGTIKKNIFAK